MKGKKCESRSVASDSLQPYSPGQNTGGDPGLLHCRQILHQLSHQGSPRVLEWVACPFCSRSSQPRNQTGGLLHCRWILYQLSYQGSPVICRLQIGWDRQMLNSVLCVWVSSSPLWVNMGTHTEFYAGSRSTETGTESKVLRKILEGPAVPFSCLAEGHTFMHTCTSVVHAYAAGSSPTKSDQLSCLGKSWHIAALLNFYWNAGQT